MFEIRFQDLTMTHKKLDHYCKIDTRRLSKVIKIFIKYFFDRAGSYSWCDMFLWLFVLPTKDWYWCWSSVPLVVAVVAGYQTSNLCILENTSTIPASLYSNCASLRYFLSWSINSEEHNSVQRYQQQHPDQQQVVVVVDSQHLRHHNWRMSWETFH